MLFSSENNCNSSIETIIKDKITLIDNNNNNNNLINLNLTSNLNTLNNLNTLSNLSLNQNKLINNENANSNYLCSNSSYAPSRQSLGNVNPLLLSPLEKENAKELIQQKILDNVIKSQKINEENQELAHYLANINVDKINEDQNANNNLLLSPVEYNVLSNNSNELILNNGDAYVTPDLSISQFAPSSEQNGLYLDPTVISPKSQNADETLNYQTTNELMNLENLLNASPNNLLASSSATQINSFLSTPNSNLLSSPLSNTIISSPESNILSSPELYDNLSPELNVTNSTLNDLTLEEYLLNQEIIKLQQEALMNSNLLGTVEDQVPSPNLLMDNVAITPQNTPELLNQPLEIPELPMDFEIELKDVYGEQQNQQNQKRKYEEEEEELETKKSKKENVINEGKPFIYVITESDDEDEENSNIEEDSQKKKKYKKKFYVCSVCGHKSKRHYNVEVHLKTHEKNRPRPFECEVCKKCFCRSHDLERHKVIHQEKMYSCELCGKKFGRLDSLKRHVGCKTCIKRQQLNIKENM